MSKYDKKMQVQVSSPNSFEHFRERYYQEFYDFYDMTIFLEEVYKVAKVLIRKKLKKLSKDEKKIEELLAEGKYQLVGE
jgi:adenosine deaminase